VIVYPGGGCTLTRRKSTWPALIMTLVDCFELDPHPVSATVSASVVAIATREPHFLAADRSPTTHPLGSNEPRICVGQEARNHPVLAPGGRI
jgi:hypothetical protein